MPRISNVAGGSAEPSLKDFMLIVNAITESTTPSAEDTMDLSPVITRIFGEENQERARDKLTSFITANHGKEKLEIFDALVKQSLLVEEKKIELMDQGYAEINGIRQDRIELAPEVKGYLSFKEKLEQDISAFREKGWSNLELGMYQLAQCSNFKKLILESRRPLDSCNEELTTLERDAKSAIAEYAGSCDTLESKLKFSQDFKSLIKGYKEKGSVDLSGALINPIAQDPSILAYNEIQAEAKECRDFSSKLRFYEEFENKVQNYQSHGANLDGLKNPLANDPLIKAHNYLVGQFKEVKERNQGALTSERSESIVRGTMEQLGITDQAQQAQVKDQIGVFVRKTAKEAGVKVGWWDSFKDGCRTMFTSIEKQLGAKMGTMGITEEELKKAVAAVKTIKAAKPVVNVAQVQEWGASKGRSK